ncbi:penicillin-binding protein 2 [Leifsonia sp. YIM 134122]|uniref:Penicillin-binding protein 2 n=1 Tax=Leifsonia stereocauli TaxID=3134136 RepID=A0ABU9W2D8_9MICO
MVALLALVSVFVVRLVDIQIVRADELNAASLAARSTTEDILGARGSIVDASGKVLAQSVMRYDVVISPKNAKPFEREVDGKEATVSVAQASAELGRALGMSGENVQAIIADSLKDDPDSDYAYVKKMVDLATWQAVDALDIQWVYGEGHPSRTYPDGAVAGNIVGFVGDDGEALAGEEAATDACLVGKDGKTSYQTGVDGVEIPGSTTDSVAAKNGGTLKLTIDSDLQWNVQQSLAQQAQAVGAAWGTAVVQEVKTGKLVAVADYPSVDPNNIDATDADDRGSRAFTASYEPGSTFKALTAASAIDAGVADPLTQVVAPYRINFPNGADINDSERHGDERLTLTGVLIESSNTGMSQIGERMTDQQRYDYYQKFGLGAESEADFPAQDPGNLNGTADSWDPQTKYATMFGQGLTTTAVQIASVYQTIANGGVRLPVQLVEGCTQEDGTVTGVPSTQGVQVVSASAAKQTSDILEMVYQQGWLADTWNIPGYRIASKTGTAQMPDGNGGYSHGYLVSVSGFAPADDPQYVVSVSLADPVNMNTSGAAAPVFKQVMSQVLKKYRVVPSGSTPPNLPANW